MTTPLLGPPGVGIVPGARVRLLVDVRDGEHMYVHAGWDGWVVGRDEASRWIVCWDEPYPTNHRAAEEIALDLSGPLDRGVRALLRLVAPEEPEPPLPPGWRQIASGAWCLGDLLGKFALFGERSRSLVDVVVVPGIEAEVREREALSLALAAVAGRTTTDTTPERCECGPCPPKGTP